MYKGKKGKVRRLRNDRKSKIKTVVVRVWFDGERFSRVWQVKGLNSP